MPLSTVTFTFSGWVGRGLQLCRLLHPSVGKKPFCGHYTGMHRRLRWVGWGNRWIFKSENEHISGEERGCAGNCPIPVSGCKRKGNFILASATYLYVQHIPRLEWEEGTQRWHRTIGRTALIILSTPRHTRLLSGHVDVQRREKAANKHIKDSQHPPRFVGPLEVTTSRTSHKNVLSWQVDPKGYQTLARKRGIITVRKTGRKSWLLVILRSLYRSPEETTTTQTLYSSASFRRQVHPIFGWFLW